MSMGAAGRTVGRLGWWLLIVCLVTALLAACGGEGSGGSLPVPSGADKLDEAEPTEEEMDELGFEASDAKAFAYKTDEDFDQVEDYYTDGVEDDGWNVDQQFSFGEMLIVLLTSDDSVVFVTATTGAGATSEAGMFDTEELDFDLEEIEEEDTVIALFRFTCEEESVEDCVSALMGS